MVSTCNDRSYGYIWVRHYTSKLLDIPIWNAVVQEVSADEFGTLLTVNWTLTLWVPPSMEIAVYMLSILACQDQFIVIPPGR